MVVMLLAAVRMAVLATTLLGGLPWVRSSSAVPRVSKPPSPARTEAEPPDRVVVLAATAPEYRALAIPKSYKTAPDALTHVLVFRGGLCIRDRGLVQTHETGGGSDHTKVIMEETGLTERAAAASDGSAVGLASTRYVSQVDLTPGRPSTGANDTVRSVTTVTLIDPYHPEGRWQITLENGRWINELLVLPSAGGLVLTTFLPRTGPADLRILDAAGRETVHVPDASGQTLRIETTPSGGFVAAEIALRDDISPWERAVTVFDLTHATQWTYGWRYGDEAEPLSWALEDGGVLAVKLDSGTRRFDPTGSRH